MVAYCWWSVKNHYKVKSMRVKYQEETTLRWIRSLQYIYAVRYFGQFLNIIVATLFWYLELIEYFMVFEFSKHKSIIKRCFCSLFLFHFHTTLIEDLQTMQLKYGYDALYYEEDLAVSNNNFKTLLRLQSFHYCKSLASTTSRISHFISYLHGCTVFSKVDLVCAYHHIPVASEDKSKTVVTTPFGLFEFLRMPLCS